jgi:hypothetical protein
MNDTDTKLSKPGMTLEQYLVGFVKNTLGKKLKHGSNWSISNENGTQVLTYTAYCDGGSRVEGKEVVAVRLKDGRVIRNAMRFKYVGSTMAWGHRTTPWRRTESNAQRILIREKAIMIAFNVLTQCGLDYHNVEVVEQGPEESVKIWRDENDWRVPDNVKGKLVKPGDTTTGLAINGTGTQEYRLREATKDEKAYVNNQKNHYQVCDVRHFVGACLFRSRKEDRTYAYMLFDIDRNEVEHNLFNPFLCQILGQPNSIAEAYEMLKPQRVKEALADGKQVKRQGEWFFIPAAEPTFVKPEIPVDLMDRLARVPQAMLMFPEKAHLLTNVEANGRVDYGRASNVLTEDEMSKYNEARGEYKKAHTEFTNLMSWAPRAGQLRTGENSPNNVEMFAQVDGDIYVKGLVTHTGREHADMMLDTWHIAIPNTAIMSYQVTGEVD